MFEFDGQVWVTKYMEKKQGREEGNQWTKRRRKDGGSIRYQSRRFKEAREQGLGST